MDNIPYMTPPRWWEPRPSRVFLWLAGPYRRLRRRFWERLSRVEVQGLEHVRGALRQGCGVLVVCNHAAHSDPLVLLKASELLRNYFYFIANWQSFHLRPWIGQRVLQWHACFSIDREGADEAAYEQAVGVLRAGGHPLVVFAEGHVNHHYQRVAPFRAGASLFAQAAARSEGRPVVWVPAAVTYRYKREPLPELSRLLSLMEEKLGWPPESHLPLAGRVRRVGEGVLELREKQYGGLAHPGPYGERAAAVFQAILGRLESDRGLNPGRLDVPGRVAQLRRRAVQQKALAPSDQAAVEDAERQLRDLQVVAQLHSYRHDYDKDEATFEHLAEIVDKLEEDVLGAVTAATRGRRCAYLRFGPPVPVYPEGTESPRRLTATMRDRVQELLDGLISDYGPWKTFPWGGA
ncbi:1-acyl-sn-glycerol-3-phosphate acyltransferase [Gemmata sp. JC673]|uniref:1-acyl-sn-glycerol-3-phosphate acyltransferase n=1 Tax=Gemmata algarum TaxID=2975278 RepID=A0ABU5F956_9BACT|nr:lysophospholipid acyltransferase family protein [Gemmata algarum]MDY3563780.1 1-acyl-sn-glycerol-3-phosphate acyltransferase [Gemmata algarum]